MQYDQVMHELGSWQSSMLRQVFAPQPTLTSFIKDYCALRQEWACDMNSQWYILPDNSAYLIFYLIRKNGRLQPSLRIIGPRSSHLIINRHSRYFTFMASFKMGGLAPFCNIPMKELCDKSTDACDLFPWLEPDLLDQLMIASQKTDLSLFISILEKALIKGLSPLQNNIHPVISFLSEQVNSSQIHVSEISDKLGITERHLRSLSQKHVGHSPKSILQIERFTRSLIMSNHSREWVAIAHDAGYYDQSHMIAEYQKMTEKSPDRLFS